MEDVNCVWGDYGNWSQCSEMCGNGTKTRTRTKYSAQESGHDCLGEEKQVQECNLGQCCGGELVNTEGVIESPLDAGGDGCM